MKRARRVKWHENSKIWSVGAGVPNCQTVAAFNPSKTRVGHEPRPSPGCGLGIEPVESFLTPHFMLKAA